MAQNEKTEDWLLPFLEGAYAEDAAKQAACEARLAADPVLAAEAVQMRQMLDAVRGVAARTPRPASASVPADSWPRLKARIQPAPRRLAWGWLGGAGAAVAVAAGVLAVILPGHHALPTAGRLPRVAVASRPAPTVPTSAPPAAKTTPLQVAETPLAKTAPGPLTQPNPNGLSNPFLTLPIPPPLPGKAAAKLPPVVIKPVPKPNPQIASRDITSGQSPEVVRPLLPLPVPPPLAPAPAAPPLPPAVTAPPAPQARAERRMFKMAKPAGQPAPAADSAAAQSRVQTFSTEAAPPAATFGRGAAGGFGGGGFGGANGAEAGAGGFGGGVDRARSLSMNRMAVPPESQTLSPKSTAQIAMAQTALAEAVASPLWGKNAGMQQINETLTGVQEAGILDDLRTKLEARRTQMPKDLPTGRMLAAVYDFSGMADAALHERQRIASLDGADGEDFFQLAQSEARAGNVDAARAAYRKALTAPTPPSGFHAAVARQGAQ